MKTMLASRGAAWALSLLSEYHDFHRADSKTQERIRHRHREIAKLFDAEKESPGDSPSEPTLLPLRQRIDLRSDTGRARGLTTSVGLDRVECEITVGAPRELEGPVLVAIEGAVTGLWWRFLGRIETVSKIERRLAIHLARTVECGVRHRTEENGERTPAP